MTAKNNKVLTISGSTRQKSVNQHLIESITRLYSDQLEFIPYIHLSELPHFNVDLDTETPPVEVVDLRNQLKMAAAVLICTPEYAMGVPGSLKNLLDWTVSSSDFSGKPVAVITASTSGEKAHESLIGTLRIIEAKVDEQATLLISHAKAKVSSESKIIDEKTLEDVKKVMTALIRNLK
ncbi:MAG TPA: NADPH-dependent FMN reductase [Bacteroidia bacterium]|nr:NADPH-dependent FMN reductase [Bacteroidia bacterium]